MRRVTIAASVLLSMMAVACQSHADDRDSTPAYGEGGGHWGVDPDVSSADLARDGWEFLSMATLSWPDGRQAVVSMWQSELGDHARCFDYFDPAMMPMGGKCERSGTGI